jgi:uncharacterized protein
MEISQIVLKVASLCNLNCSYCYIYNSEDTAFGLQPKTISDHIYDVLLHRMNEYAENRPGHNFSITFHGGEPTLIGSHRFVELVKRARLKLGNRLASVGIQTNATRLTSQWCTLFRDHSITTSVSLDGPAHIHDATRINHAGRGSHASVVRGLRLLQDAGLQPSVLCVINPRYSGEEVYRHFRALNVCQIDFLLPDVSHDNKDRLYGGLGPTPVGDYLVSVLEAWMREDNPNVKIRTLEDLFRKLMGGVGSTDGFGGGSGYIIVETDGSIEPNDALRVCADRITRSHLNVLSHSFDEISSETLVHKVAVGFELPDDCRSCTEREICGGGYLPHRYSRDKGFNNPSVWCTDIQKLLANMRSHVADCPPTR